LKEVYTKLREEHITLIRRVSSLFCKFGFKFISAN
jgi:hypothetical protein